MDWPTFRDLWLHVAHGGAQNGLATALLAPFMPQQLEELPGRLWVEDLHFVVLDCDDDVRRQRIEASRLAVPGHRRSSGLRSLAA